MKSNAVKLLQMQWKYNTEDVIDKNIEGITDEEALVFPNGEANCANWIFGHLIFIRNAMIELFGGKPVWNNEDFKIYDRGAKPLEHRDEFLKFSELKEYYKKSNQELEQILENLEDLKPENIDDTAGLMLHEIYHAGQLGYIRRLLGKEGAIK